MREVGHEIKGESKADEKKAKVAKLWEGVQERNAQKEKEKREKKEQKEKEEEEENRAKAEENEQMEEEEEVEQDPAHVERGRAHERDCTCGPEGVRRWSCDACVSYGEYWMGVMREWSDEWAGHCREAQREKEEKEK